MREKLDEIVKHSPLWDGRTAKLQVYNSNATTLELRALVSARTASESAELRFEVREKLIEFLASEHPSALPHARAEALQAGRQRPAAGDAHHAQAGGPGQ